MIVLACLAGQVIGLLLLTVYWSVKARALPAALTLPPSLYEVAPAPGLGEHGFYCIRVTASLTEVRPDALYMTIAHRHTPEYARRCANQFLVSRGIPSPIVSTITF